MIVLFILEIWYNKFWCKKSNDSLVILWWKEEFIEKDLTKANNFRRLYNKIKRVIPNSKELKFDRLWVSKLKILKFQQRDTNVIFTMLENI